MQAKTIDFPQRNFQSWIDSWVAASSVTNAPEIFRKWGAVSAISTALQRKVFITVMGRKLYPNLYIMLVGGPGIGKTLSIEPVRNVLAGLKHVSLSPARLSPEKFIQLVSRSARLLPQPNEPFYTQSAYAVCVSEIASFIRANDREIMTTLTDFYDCPKTWTYATLSRDEDRIENLYLTLLGGITPKTFAENFGTASIGMGFTSRVNFIYSDEYSIPEIFDTPIGLNYEPFQEDLRKIHDLHGEFFFDKKTAKKLQDWVSSGMAPAPTDAKLAEYIPRRWLHVVKLCIAFSAAESSSMIIEGRHYEQAKALLLEAEAVASKAFEYLGNNPMMEAIRNLHTWALAEYAKNKKGLPEAALKKILIKDVQPQYLNFALSEITLSGYFTITGIGASRIYIPQEKE